MSYIVYHGLGYVGLTGAVHFARAGQHIIGYDPDQTVVDAINAGTPKAGEFLAYLGAGDWRSHFVATTAFHQVAQERTHILAVPSERDGEPWMELVYQVVGKLLALIPDGSLIIIESTMVPGAIDHIVNQVDVEHRIVSGAVRLAVAPRRDWFADPSKNLATIPRILGGYTLEATAAARRILEDVTPAELILETDYRTAELVKPLENALFHLPIALGHELAMVFPDRDIVEALRLAVTHWRFASFGGLYVGAGTGGRCVPLGPKYLQDSHDGNTSHLLNQALQVEHDITSSLAGLVEEHLTSFEHKDELRVLILGLAYRPGFSDIGFSPGIRLARALRRQSSFGFVPHRFTLDLHDPVARMEEIFAAMGDAKHSVVTGTPDLGRYDVVVLVTPHEEYRLLPTTCNWISGQVVIDARGMWASYFGAQDMGADVTYRQIGKPGWRSTP